MSTRGVRTNWQLVAKIKKIRSATSYINVDEKHLGLVLKMKEQQFNETIIKDEESTISHPTMLSKYFKRFLPWKKEM